MSFINHLVARTVNSFTTTLNKVAPSILAARRYILYGGSAASASYLFSHYLYDWGTTTGPSMYPTLPDGDIYVFHERLSKREIANSAKDDPSYRKLKVGDVIQFTSPIFDNMLAGKRIIGMPGDYVVRDVAEAPSVGGASVPGITDFRTDREIERGVELKEREEPEMIQVPEGHVWVAGDNFSWSRDSRFYGPVPMALIRGVTKFGCEGVFTWVSYGGALTSVSKEDEEWVLQGRPARLVSVDTDDVTAATGND